MSNVIDLPDRKAIAEEAAMWLIKMDGDSSMSPAEKEELRRWITTSAAHKDELENLATLWGSMNVLTELAVPIERQSRRMESIRDGLVSGRGYRAALAAGLAILVVGLVVTFSTRDGFSESTNGYYATAIGQQKSIILADGSDIYLNTDSQIDVDYDSKLRSIRLLKGEAHFTVAKNPDRPFRVHAGNGYVEAIGTAFSVRVRDEGVDVVVTEGRVALGSGSVSVANLQSIKASQSESTSNADLSAAGSNFRGRIGTLSAGQIGTIPSTRDSEVIDSDFLRTVSDVEMARLMSWKDGLITFSGEPLEEVVREISRYTTVKIDIYDPDVRKIRIGGRFPVGETDAMFEALEENFGLEVTHVGTDRIILSASTDARRQ